MRRSYSTTVYLPSATHWYHALDPQRRLIRGTAYAWIKRAIDVLVCLLGLPFVLLLIGVSALLIRQARSAFPHVYLSFAQMNGNMRGRE